MVPDSQREISSRPTTRLLFPGLIVLGVLAALVLWRKAA